MRSLATPVEIGRARPRRHRRDRRRALDLQRLDLGGAGRRRRRLRGRQARQPLEHQQVAAPPTCSRRSASTSTSSPSRSARCIDEVGFGFMFAPRHHAAMAHVVPVRKELAVRTIFNFLGPLTNPAGAERQLLGVSDRHYQETIAEALVGLGSERAMVVSAEDGVDELAISAPHPGDRGRRAAAPPSGSSSPASSASPRPSWTQVAGGTPEENAAATAGRLRRRARPAPRPGPAQRRRRDLRRRRRRGPRRRASRRPPRRSTRGEAGILLERLIAATAARRRLGFVEFKWE